jgi:sugar phosphate isomerase/epimerase
MMIVCGYEQHALPAQLEVVHRLGATHVELYPRWAASPDPHDSGRMVRDFGLEVWSAHGPWGSETWQGGRVDLAATDEAARRASVADVRRAIAWLADATGTRLVVHPGVLSDESQAAVRRAALLQSLADLAPIAAAHDVYLCVENLPPKCWPGSRMSDLVSIVEELGASHVGLCLDTGHANIVADAASFARAAGSWLRTTHVHDNDGARDEHRLPGQGTVRWSELTAALAAIDYRGVIMIECPRYLRDHPEEVNDQLREQLAELCRRLE